MPVKLSFGVEINGATEKSGPSTTERVVKDYIPSLASELSAVEAAMNDINSKFESARRQEVTLVETTSNILIDSVCTFS